MPSVTSREWRLVQRPRRRAETSDFLLATVESPEPGPGQVQVRNLWMTVDPYMRGRMNDAKSYAAPFELGQAMNGGAVGQVLASRDDNFKPGDLVTSFAGWREAFTAPPAAVNLTKLPNLQLPPQAYLGVAGMPGHTAWAGLLKIGEPKPGETVFVSGAAGAVGSIVGQIAKIKGCHVVGSAGGKDKCDYLKSIGFDEAIDYRAAGDPAAPPRFCSRPPCGASTSISITSGATISPPRSPAPTCAHADLRDDLALQRHRPLARAQQHDKHHRPPHQDPGFHRVRLRSDLPRVREGDGGLDRLGPDQVRRNRHERGGKAVDAFLALFSGGNTGKMLVKLG